MILNDKQIKKLAEEQEMISPYVGENVSKGISHGQDFMATLYVVGLNLKYLLI